MTAVVRESHDIVSVWMRGRHLDRLPVAAGQFFTWRFLDRHRLDPRPPLLAVRRPHARHPADHRQGPRRRQSALAWRTSGPAPGCSSKAPTAGCTPASGPAARSPSWPPASASPRCARCSRRLPAGPRRHHPGLPRPHSRRPRPEGRARRARRPPRRPHLLRPRPARPPCRRQGLVAAGDRSAPDRRPGAASARPGHRRATTSTSAARQTWMDAARQAALDAGVPADHIHLERFSW